MAAAPAAPGPAVILVRPQLGENVGTAARAMLNFGLTDLRLVRPQCGWPNVKALNAASGANEVLNRLQLFATVEQACADLQRVYATTARGRDLAKREVSAAGAAREARAARAAGQGVGILFGPERTGLTNDELIYADAVLRIPVNPEFVSLNLAQAVLLVAYEWWQSADPLPARAAIAATGPPATQPAPQPATRSATADCDQERARGAARPSGGRARCRGLLPHPGPAAEHGARAAGDLRPRRARHARRPPPARRDQAAGARPPGARLTE